MIEPHPLPSGWRWVRLGEIGTLTDGDWILNSDYSSSGVRLLQVGDIGLGKFIGKSNRYITLERAKELNCTLLKLGDILISRMPEPIGRACTMPELPYPCITAVDVTIYRTKESVVDQEYIVDVLNSPDILAQVSELASGATRQRISRKNLEMIKIPLPPLPEQKRIATKLQEQMQAVERARTACEKQLEAAKVLPAAYLRQVFESEEAQKWEKKRLREVCEVVSGSTPRTDDPTNWNGDILWATPNDMGKLVGFTIEDTERKISEKGFKSCSTKLLPIGSVLLTTRAPIGHLAINSKPMCTNQGFKSLIPLAQIHNYFLFSTLKYFVPILQFIGRGQTFTEISKKQVEDFEIPLPPLPEQKRIATYLKEKIEEVEKLRTAIENRLEAINALQQAILRKAFRGEL